MTPKCVHDARPEADRRLDPRSIALDAETGEEARGVYKGKSVELARPVTGERAASDVLSP